MSRLVWDERKYQSGISKGVFYPLGGQGVVWNGLVSVTEQSVGGEHTPHYLDGIKFLEFVGNKNYQAIITSFAAPTSFRRFAGERPYVPGIRLSNQPKRRFNFTYRTEHTDGYKIHLVYNALATPQARLTETLRPGSEPPTISWVVDATPPPVPDWEGFRFRPTAHFVLDTAQMPEGTSGILTWLEDFLYGTSILPAQFPDAEEFLSHFT